MRTKPMRNVSSQESVKCSPVDMNARTLIRNKIIFKCHNFILYSFVYTLLLSN